MNFGIFSLNHIAGFVVNDGDYTPFAVSPNVSDLVYDETQAYAPGPAWFFRTGHVKAELDVFELREVHNTLPTLPSVLLGLLAKSLGSLENAWIAAHALLPSLIWAVLFWNAWRIVHSGLFAAATAWITSLVAFSPRNSLLLGKGSFTSPPEITRLAEPALSFLFLMLAIWLLSRALERPAPLLILATGIASGALFYLYYYYWIAFFAGAVSLLLVAAFIRRRDYVNTTALVILLGCLTGTPFILTTLEGLRSGQLRHIMDRDGDFTRRSDPIGLLLALVLFGALYLYCARRIGRQGKEGSPFAALLLATSTGAAIGLNFQLLTGFDAQRVHFYHRVLQPLLTCFALLMLFGAIRAQHRFRALAIRATAALTAILLAMTAWQQIEVGRNTAEYHRKTNPDIDVLLWIRSHLPPDIVIGSTDGNVLTLIPGIAGTWTFVPSGGRSVASNDEILKRYLLLGLLEGRNWPEIETGLRSDHGFNPYFFSMSEILVMPRYIRPEAIFDRARVIWNSIDLKRDFEDRRIDYIVHRRDDIVPESSRLSGFDTLYQNSAWRLYRVRH